MSALTSMTRTEARLFFRDPVGPLMVLALPVLLVVGFGLIPGFRDPSPGLGGEQGTEFIAALGVGIVLAILGLTILPTTLGTYRQIGVLRRLRATPVRPVTLLGAQLVLTAASIVTSVLLVVVVGAAGFHVALPRNPAGFVLSVLLGAAALVAVGLMIAAVAPNAKAANAIGMMTFFPSMFLGGVYVPRDTFPPVLQHISDATPLGAAIQAVRDTWQGGWPEPVHLVTMTLWALVAGAVAARSFRWE